MRTLANTIKWDLLIQNKYQIINVLFAVTGLYLLLLWLVPALRFDELLILLVFFDPSMLGLTFIGALVLFEKGDNTLEALVVTPIKLWQYLWSKALSLTIMAVLSGILIAGMGHGWGQIDYSLFIPGVALTSILYALMGLGLVANVQTLNGYLIKVALLTIP
ncbi:MAG: ABC transporter permease, partial [Bacteroidota bacterium]